MFFYYSESYPTEASVVNIHVCKDQVVNIHIRCGTRGDCGSQGACAVLREGGAVSLRPFPHRGCRSRAASLPAAQGKLGFVSFPSFKVSKFKIYLTNRKKKVPATLSTFKSECGPQATHWASELFGHSPASSVLFLVLFPSLLVSEIILFPFAVCSSHTHL